MDDPLKEKLFQTFRFLNDCTGETRDTILSGSLYRRIPAGTLLVNEGEECGHLPMVLEGCLKVVKLAETGREITLYRIEKGESCILTATCILSSTSFPAVAIAEEETETVFIPSAAMKHLINTSESIRNFVFELYSRRLTSVLILIEEIAFKKMDSRIAKYLLQQQAASGKNRIFVTHQEIAAEIGTSREVVSRVLKDMEKKNTISISRGNIRLLNIADLEKIRSI